MVGETDIVREPRSPARRSRPLRVALVTSSYNFIQDGVALTLNRLVGYLESRGVEVLVFAPVAKRPAFAHQGTIVPAPSAPLPLRPEYRLAFGLTRGLRRRLEAFDPDLIHIAVPDFLGKQAQEFGLATGRPVVASYHTRYDTYLEHYGLQFLNPMLRRRLVKFFAACREVYVPSASMAEVLMAEGRGGNIHLWLRGVDTQRFDPARRSEAWRAGRGFKSDDVVVAFVGRLVREKRLDTVRTVFERLAPLGRRMLIVGDGPEREVLKKALPGAVFTGFLTGDELATAYACADLFLFPSDTETFGNVTLEAMASGLPAVCADATGSRSLVEPGVTGFLAPPGDDEAFFAAVRELAFDADLRRRMSLAARERSLRFSWEDSMAGLLARYEALVAS